jgi:cardiolipin synthase
MNLPNLISIIRVVSIPVFVYFLVYDHQVAAFLTFVFASLSDGLDGLLARLLHQKTTLGTYLDPMADKLLTATAFVTLAILGVVPVWLVIIVISRDIIISLGALITYLVTGSLTIVPLPLGKATTFFQFLTLSASLAGPFFFIPEHVLMLLFAVTTLLTVASGLQYIYAGVSAMGS